MNINNEYYFDIESINETTKAWYKYRFANNKKFIEYLFVCVLVSASILLLFFETINFASIIISVCLGIVIPLLTIVLTYKTAIKNSIKMQKERYEMLYKNKKNIISIILSEKEIIFSTTGIDKSINYNDIIKVIESANFIILLLKGDSTLSLKKDSFKNETTENTIQFINKKIKSSKK